MSEPESKLTALSRWKRRWYGRVPITITLASAIGFLVLVAVGSVFGVGVWLAQKNTFDLISANAHQAIAADVSQIELHLQPAEHQVQFIAEQIVRGEIDPYNHENFGPLLVGALSAAPQIEAIIFMDPDQQAFAAGRKSGSSTVQLNTEDYSKDPTIRKNTPAVKGGPVWLPPIWREQFEKTYLSRAHPIIRDGEFLGAMVAVVSVERLSNFISIKGLETSGNRFILYGPDKILAHWLLSDDYPGLSAEKPLPELKQFGDPILSSMWQENGRKRFLLNLPDGTEGHLLNIFNENYAYVYRKLDGYGLEPLFVGAYFQESDFTNEVRRLIAALFTGILALLLSLLAAIVLGRRIARPIVEFSAAATRIKDLDVSKVRELKGSVFRELNQQSSAFNAMLRALRWFELYVPKKVVGQLIKHGEFEDGTSNAHEITVMFTDIVGFSTLSEDMSALELAAFINEHLSIVVGGIEAENGTVDKYMGDAVMAFWATTDDKDFGASQACRAALNIAALIRADNKRRVDLGLLPVGIRIGIHTGVATVGNIGPPGRLNYTIIGDTVNIGQRLEQLGKDLCPNNSDVSILISGDTAEKLDGSFKVLASGSHTLKGRVNKVDVFILETNITS
ncbi:MAG: adenylate/guanylate cyclase domain-containing protein [Granulosicoccus sp.]